MGKSTVVEQVVRHLRNAETNPAVVPAIIVQASPEDVGSAARLDYYQQVLDQFQHHPAIRDRTKNLPLYINRGKKSNDPAEWLEVRNVVEYALRVFQVKVVFVDEGQHLLAPDPLRKPTAQLDWLKALANRTNVLHVLVGNFDLYEYCHLNGQTTRRMRDQHFSRYHLDNQKECEEFVGALQSLLENVPLTVDVPALLSHWRWFWEWSTGCVGVLGDWIVETVDALWSENKTVLTVDALTSYALQPDQRARLEMEARTGEHRVARAKVQSEQDLQRLLDAHANEKKSAQAVDPTTNGREQERKGKPVERATVRDPVGDQVPKGNTLRCTFSDVLDIEPGRFQESRVARGECPECAALRQLQLRNGILRYPSHERRKTQTLQTERRWAQGETRWEIISGTKQNERKNR